MPSLRTAFCILLFLIMSVTATTANSSNWNDWYWRFDVGASHSTVGDGTSSTGRIGVMPDGSDVVGGSPIEIRNDISKVYAAIYHENGVNNWEGDTGFYSDYYRVPILLTPGSQKRWQFYVWATPMMSTTDDIGLGLQFMNPELVPEYVFTLRLVTKPVAVGEYPVAATSWQLGMAPFSLVLPMYRTEEGRTGYLFELSATAVPEPSGLLALTAGLGYLTTVIRRRRF